MENNKIYCILCGAENAPADKFCHKCGQSLAQQENELQDYLKNKVTDKIKDTVKDKATESFFDLLKKFLNSKAYGIIMSLSIVTATATTLMGGNTAGNATEFAADLPGQFIDGSIHRTVQMPDTNAVYTGLFEIYPVDNSLSEFYIISRYQSAGVGIKVISEGKTVLDVPMEEASTTKIYTIKGKNPEIYMALNYRVPGDTIAYTLNEETIKIDSSFGICYQEEKVDGVQVLLEEFSAPDVFSHRVVRYSYGTDENGKPLYLMTEQFYDEKGRETLRESTDINGELSSCEEYVYDDTNRTIAHTYSEYGEIKSYSLHTSDHIILEEISYLDGEIFTSTTYEYYPSGKLLAETSYTSDSNNYNRFEYHENGNRKSYTVSGINGEISYQAFYDENGYELE